MTGESRLNLKVRYVDSGNIPSHWAHSIHIMKMSEALAQAVDDFVLYVACYPSEVLPGRRYDYETQYGIRRPFPIRRLPTRSTPRCPKDKTAYHDFARWVARLLAWDKPDVVFSRNYLVLQALAERGVPVILEAHVTEKSGGYQDVLRVIRQPSVRGCVTISPVLENVLLSAGVPKEKVFVWPDAVNPTEFEGLPSVQELRLQLGLPTDRPIAMYVGQMYPGKGAEEVLEAARRMDSVQWVLVGGTDADRARCRAQAQGLNNVLFTGMVPRGQTPAYMGAADVLLLPMQSMSVNTTWLSPLKLFEYMAARRPIVATDLSFLRPILHEGNAHFVTPDSAEALARGVEQVLANPAWAEALVACAAAEVQQYTWRNRAQAILHRFGYAPQGTGMAREEAVPRTEPAAEPLSFRGWQSAIVIGKAVTYLPRSGKRCLQRVLSKLSAPAGRAAAGHASKTPSAGRSRRSAA